MYVECKNCGKKFPQSESLRDKKETPDNMCFCCALTEITAEYDVDEEPDQIDIKNAWCRSQQMHQEELQEIEEERRRYPEESDDEQEWCEHCRQYGHPSWHHYEND